MCGLASDHVDELGLSQDARNVIYRAAGYNEERDSFDWLHINAMTYLGLNRWYDGGDERFNPRNVMLSIRRPNTIAIIDQSGAVVWRMGPDYRQLKELAAIGQIIAGGNRGQVRHEHQVHRGQQQHVWVGPNASGAKIP